MLTIFRAFVLPHRSGRAWAACKDQIVAEADRLVIRSSLRGGLSLPMPAMTPRSTPPPPQPGLQFQVLEIQTNYNPHAAGNKPNPCSSDREENACWTDMQREAASKGVVVEDPEQLRTSVRNTLLFINTTHWFSAVVGCSLPGGRVQESPKHVCPSAHDIIPRVSGS